ERDRTFPPTCDAVRWAWIGPKPVHRKVQRPRLSTAGRIGSRPSAPSLLAITPAGFQSPPSVSWPRPVPHGAMWQELGTDGRESWEIVQTPATRLGGAKKTL